MAHLSETFTTPFFLGGISGTTLPMPFTISLDQHVYTLDLRKYVMASQDVLKPSYSTSAIVDESLFNANGAWSRYRYSWDHGADQEFGDLHPDLDPFRFKISRGVDVWTEHALTLLHSTTNRRACASSNPLMQTVGDRLYIADGTVLYYVGSASVDAAISLTITGLTGTINSMTSDGTDLYVATTTFVYKVAGTDTAATAFSVAGGYTTIAFVANRLLVSKLNVLYELTSGGTLVGPIKTHYQPAFVWKVIINIGSKIYIGGYAGIRSELYSMTVDSTGQLVASAEAAPLPLNELLNTGFSYAGGVLLGTSKGIRFAQVGGDGTLTYGPLIDKVGDVRCITAEGRFAWCGWTSFQDSGSGVARLALDVNVAALQPAYASDVFTTSTGTVTGVARIGSKTVFAVASVGVFVESATAFATTGYVNQGIITFGTVEEKVLTSLLVHHTDLAAAETITLSVLDDMDVLLTSATSSIDGEVMFEADAGGIYVHDTKIVVTLVGPGTTTPHLHHWRIRCFPVTPPVEQWTIPLIFHSRVAVNDGTGQELSMNVLDEVDRIKNWWRAKTPIVYREGGTATRVRIDAYEFVPDDWDDAGNFYEATMTLRIVTA